MKRRPPPTTDSERRAAALRRATLAPSDHNFEPAWLANGSVVRWLGWRHRYAVYLFEPTPAAE